MSLWTITIVVLLVALLLPLFSVLRDAPRFRRTNLPESESERIPATGDDAARRLAHRVQALEDEIDELRAMVHDLREEADALRSILQGSDRPER